MSSVPRLLPSQVCFVVDDVPAAAAECSERYRWGPFHHFTVRVPDAHYRGWKGLRCNDVALGMAGGVQVELVHVHEGREPIADYQTRYGTGFQHLGIGCRSRDVALLHLEMLGAQVNELNEHEGIRIAFVDVPTGTAMFELLQFPPRGEGDAGIEASARPQEGGDVFALDRATIVTPDLAGALRFHAGAFGWEHTSSVATTASSTRAACRRMPRCPMRCSQANGPSEVSTSRSTTGRVARGRSSCAAPRPEQSFWRHVQ
jgi:hypothetical protein